MTRVDGVCCDVILLWVKPGSADGRSTKRELSRSPYIQRNEGLDGFLWRAYTGNTGALGGFLNRIIVMDPITTFLKETKTELKKVSWPTREQTFQYTIIVIGASLVVAAFLGGLDFVFNLLLIKLTTMLRF